MRWQIVVYLIGALAAFVGLAGVSFHSRLLVLVARVLTAAVAFAAAALLIVGAVFLWSFGAAFGGQMMGRDLLLLTGMFGGAGYFLFSGVTVFRSLQTVRSLAHIAHVVVMPLLVICIALPYGPAGFWRALAYNGLSGIGFAMLWYITIAKEQ